jgi:hypothetical protein
MAQVTTTFDLMGRNTELLVRGGIVNLTRVWQTGQHEKPNSQLPTSPFSL